MVTHTLLHLSLLGVHGGSMLEQHMWNACLICWEHGLWAMRHLLGSISSLSETWNPHELARVSHLAPGFLNLMQMSSLPEVTWLLTWACELSRQDHLLPPVLPKHGFQSQLDSCKPTDTAPKDRNWKMWWGFFRQYFEFECNLISSCLMMKNKKQWDYVALRFMHAL